MLRKRQIMRAVTAIGAFVLVFGVLMFYLQFEGVTTYEYLFAETPDAVLPHSLDRDLLDMTWQMQGQTVNSVRIRYSDAESNYVTGIMDWEAVPLESELVRSGREYAISRHEKNEIIFFVEPMDMDKLHIQLSKPCTIEAIEVYQASYYKDESKYIPQALNMGISLLFALLFALSTAVSDISWRKGKGFALPSLILLLEMAMLHLIFKSRRYDGYSMKVESVMIAVFSVIILTLLLAYWALFTRRISMEYVYIPCSIVLGIAVMLLVPPFAVPDENTHYMQAQVISSMALGQSEGNQHVMRQCDYDIYQEMYSTLTRDMYYRKYDVLLEWDKDQYVDTTEYGFRLNRLKNVPLGYMASGLAVALGRILNLDALSLFYLGRMANLLIFTAMMALTIAILPYGKSMIMTFALFPMVLQQAASYSYDPIVTGGVFLFASYAMRLAEQKENISLKQYGLLLGLGVLMAPSKMVYSPVLLLAFLIPIKKYRFGRMKALWPVLLIGISMMAILVTQVGTLSTSLGQSGIGWAKGAPAYTVGLMLGDIRKTVNVYLNTLALILDKCYVNLICGSLGWLQESASARQWITAVFVALFLFSCQRCEQENTQSLSSYKRWGVVFTLIMTAGLVMTSMLLACTPASYDFISGIQGRYFAPALILLIPIIRNDQIILKLQALNWCVLLAGFSSLLAIMQIFSALPA